MEFNLLAHLKTSSSFDTKSSVKNLIEHLKTLELEKIEVLNLSNFVFHPEAMNELAPVLRNLKNLKEIKGKNVFSALPRKEMIKSFNLLCCGLMGESDETIEKVFKYEKNAKDKTNSDGNIDPINDYKDNLEFYVNLEDKNYKRITRLEKVDFSENAISWTIPAFFKELITSSEYIRELHLTDCGLGIGGMKSLINALGKIHTNTGIQEIEYKNPLKVLNISRNKITGELDHISNNLNKMPKLKSLTLSYNTIPKENIDKFLQDIYEDKNYIPNLNLKDNFIGDMGMFCLGKMFVEVFNEPFDNETAEFLISDCYIQDSGMEKFFEGKNSVENTEKYLKARKTLDLAYNDLSFKSFKLMAENLKNEENLNMSVFGCEVDYLELDEFSEAEVEVLNELKDSVIEKGGEFVIEEPEDEELAQFETKLLEETFANLSLKEN